MAGSLKLRRDDEVIVIAGKDKGRTGRILRVDPEREKVWIEGLNIVKRHQRAQPGVPNAPVGVIEKEGPIHVSNVAIVEDGKPSRVGIVRENGKRFRVAKRSGRRLD